MVYREIRVGEVVELGGRRVTAIPANHTVPAVGYRLDSGRSSLIYTGDTACNDALWRAVNATANLKYLIIETAFSNKERDIAVASKHLCPQMLAEELEKMRVRPEVYITHLKPGEGALTMKEVSQAAAAGGRACSRTTRNFRCSHATQLPAGATMSAVLDGNKIQSPNNVADMSVKLAFSKKIQAVTNRIHSTANIDEIILDVSRDICQLFEADRMTVYITSEDGSSIVSKVKTGSTRSRTSSCRSRSRRSPATARSTAAHMNIRDVYDDAELSSTRPNPHFLKAV
jgi:hypothetical protein